jgi:Protein of unknown function (DUF2878)
MPLLANFLAFQFGWFACVLGGAYGLPWLGSSIAVLIVAWHMTHAARPKQELILILIAGAIGAVWDSALVILGWISYPSGTLLAGTAPYWIVALWMLFATTLNVSLAWLKRSMLLAALFGAVGGPLAYYGGAKLGALSFTAPAPALMALALGWGLLTPLLIKLALRFDGFVSTLDARPQVEVAHD